MRHAQTHEHLEGHGKGAHRSEPAGAWWGWFRKPKCDICYKQRQTQGLQRIRAETSWWDSVRPTFRRQVVDASFLTHLPGRSCADLAKQHTFREKYKNNLAPHL